MSDKKKIRERFRKAVFTRDKNKCRMCGRSDVKLDSHHIVDRKELPNGGYVKENGITLCDEADGCHFKAEQWHSTGKCAVGFTPDELYNLIGSSRAIADEASKLL